jgi:hypothetical protein
LRHPALFRGFLDKQGNLEEESFFVTKAVPIVAAAAYHGPASSLELLLARGGNVNVKDGQGITPLMMAAASARPNAAIVKLLIERGAEVNAHDRGGRTALDWALLQGDTPAAAVLRTAGAETSAPATAPPQPVAAPRRARDAVALAVTRLQPIGPAFNQRTRCISCHNQSLPAIAVALASRREVPIDRTFAAHPTTATLAMWQPFYEELLLGNAYILGGFVPNSGYGLLALAEGGVPASPTTDAVVLGLMAVQNRDGSWWIDDIRPPLGDDSRIYYTALAIRGLAAYGPPGRRTEIRARIQRARDLLRRTEQANTQDEVFKLLGLLWSQASSTEVARQAASVRKLQRTDGGWAQTPSMTSDAYSTGQALYALHAAGTEVTAPAYQSGARFLLRTQLEDGSWFVRARGFAFQPYFDTGFPHGRDQFISAAATSWAAIALAYTL